MTWRVCSSAEDDEGKLRGAGHVNPVLLGSQAPAFVARLPADDLTMSEGGFFALSPALEGLRVPEMTRSWVALDEIRALIDALGHLSRDWCRERLKRIVAYHENVMNACFNASSEGCRLQRAAALTLSARFYRLAAAVSAPTNDFLGRVVRDLNVPEHAVAHEEYGRAEDAPEELLRSKPTVAGPAKPVLLEDFVATAKARLEDSFELLDRLGSEPSAHTQGEVSLELAAAHLTVGRNQLVEGLRADQSFEAAFSALEAAADDGQRGECPCEGRSGFYETAEILCDHFMTAGDTWKQVKPAAMQRGISFQFFSPFI